MTSMPFHPAFGSSKSGTDRKTKVTNEKNIHHVPAKEQRTLAKFDQENERRDRMEAAREERARQREERKNQ